MSDKKKANSSGQDSTSDTQSFNEQDYEADQTKGAKAIKEDSQSTGQDRDRMSKMGVKKAKK
jgi:hypothetical protein